MHVSTPRRSARAFRATRTRVLAAALTAALALLVAPSAPTAQANLPVERTHHRTIKVKVDPRLFGVHDYYANSLQRFGTGAIRLWDAGTMWRDIFPTQDVPNWTRLDSLVTQAHANGTEVTLVLGMTPQYAAANPAIASLLQSWRPVGRVAELGSLGRKTHAHG